MSSWQSFIVAWVAAQCFPAVSADPTPENIISAGLLLLAVCAVFISLNITCNGVKKWLSRVSAPSGCLRTDP